MLQPGARFAGYRIVRRIGAGGMGVVYLADHPRLPRQDVLKLLPADHLADPRFRGRFDREADLAARLRHPNIVTVHDRGVTGGQPWIAMEYVPGTDAAALVASADLDPRRAAHIIDDVARGLDHAHRNRMLHRDVKPANILVTADPDREFGERALLADFGIARLSRDNIDFTRTGDVIATVSYAAPEQFTGGPIDHRADVYALGCTLFVMLTGGKLFAMDSTAAVINAHLHTPPPPASGRVPGLPPAIDAVLARALAKNPADRYDSCRAFSADAISALESSPASGAPGRGSASTTPLPAITATATPTPTPTPTPGHTPAVPADSISPAGSTAFTRPTAPSGATSPAGPRRTRTRIVAVSAAVLLAAGLTTAVVFATDGTESDTAAPSATGGTAAPGPVDTSANAPSAPPGPTYTEAWPEAKGTRGKVSWDLPIPQVNGGAAAVADKFNSSVRAALQDKVDSAPESATLTAGPPGELHIGQRVLSALLVTTRKTDPPDGKPETLLATITINADNAEPITLRNLFPDLNAGLRRLSEEAARLLPATAAGPDYNREGTAPRPKNFHHWVATPEGMAVHFEKNSVAPPDKGLISITVPWTSLAGVLDPALAEVLRS
ncbi:serine/threonine-protein kinase [Nocardia sp. NPDC019395]|uniref:serine/threonine-protein kinase n=1 Tax=Nocardia sp. NPDC019395 TaxID=3154686 RepID=UPI0033E7E08A